MTEIRKADDFITFYNKLLPKQAALTFPKEIAATCSDCAMYGDEKDSRRGIVVFSRETKCCTFYPNLPNYLAGALLSDPDPAMEAGRKRIRNIIESRVNSTPQGILQPGRYKLIYDGSHSAFGRSRELLCPLYDGDGGKCTIRPYWTSICRCWHCKFDAGQDGWEFWNASRDYLKHIEETLSIYSLYAMKWDPGQIHPSCAPRGDLTAREVDMRAPGEKEYKRLWRKWAGREEEFFKETFQIVSSLTPSRFSKISGITGAILRSKLDAKQRKLTKPGLPDVLRRNPDLKVEKLDKNRYMLIGYSPFDPLEVPGRMYDLIDSFDGRSTVVDTCSSIRRKGGQAPDRDLLISLFQFRILIGDED